MRKKILIVVVFIVCCLLGIFGVSSYSGEIADFGGYSNSVYYGCPISKRVRRLSTKKRL